MSLIINVIRDNKLTRETLMALPKPYSSASNLFSTLMRSVLAWTHSKVSRCTCTGTSATSPMYWMGKRERGEGGGGRENSEGEEWEE